MAYSSEDLISRIRDDFPSYSRAFKQLGSYVLTQTFAASSMNIETLAQAANVSVATVNRFAHECGCEGYAQFRYELRALFDRIFEPAENVCVEQENAQNVITQSLDNMIENLDHMRATLDEQTLNNAVEMILASKSIFVAGFGVSAIHASFLMDSIEPFLTKSHIKVLTDFCGPERAFRRAAMFTEKDLLIAITLPRYSQSITDLALVARKQGSKVLSLTDQLSSPLTPLSDEVLMVASKHPILYTANTPMVALIEVITMAIMRRVENLVEQLSSPLRNLLYIDDSL